MANEGGGGRNGSTQDFISRSAGNQLKMRTESTVRDLTEKGKCPKQPIWKVD